MGTCFCWGQNLWIIHGASWGPNLLPRGTGWGPNIWIGHGTGWGPNIWISHGHRLGPEYLNLARGTYDWHFRSISLLWGVDSSDIFTARAKNPSPLLNSAVSERIRQCSYEMPLKLMLTIHTSWIDKNAEFKNIDPQNVNYTNLWLFLSSHKDVDYREECLHCLLSNYCSIASLFTSLFGWCVLQINDYVSGHFIGAPNQYFVFPPPVGGGEGGALDTGQPRDRAIWSWEDDNDTAAKNWCTLTK